jgi:hypothetical protein
MAIIVSNFKNERFLNQVDILYQIFCYRGVLQGGVLKNGSKKDLAVGKENIFLFGVD